MPSLTIAILIISTCMQSSSGVGRGCWGSLSIEDLTSCRTGGLAIRHSLQHGAKSIQTAVASLRPIEVDSLVTKGSSMYAKMWISVPPRAMVELLKTTHKLVQSPAFIFILESNGHYCASPFVVFKAMHITILLSHGKHERGARPLTARNPPAFGIECCVYSQGNRLIQQQLATSAFGTDRPIQTPSLNIGAENQLVTASWSPACDSDWSLPSANPCDCNDLLSSECAEGHDGAITK